MATDLKFQIRGSRVNCKSLENFKIECKFQSSKSESLQNNKIEYQRNEQNSKIKGELVKKIFLNRKADGKYSRKIFNEN